MSPKITQACTLKKVHIEPLEYQTTMQFVGIGHNRNVSNTNNVPFIFYYWVDDSAVGTKVTQVIFNQPVMVW